MQKYSDDELLYMVGEKIDLENLQEPCEYHQFSKEYEERMGKLRMQVKENESTNKTKKQRNFMKRWVAAAAIIALAGGISVGGYAYYRAAKMSVVKEDKEVLIVVEQENPEETESVLNSLEGKSMEEIMASLPAEGVQVPKVTFELGYIPKGYHENKNNLNHYQTSDDFVAPGFWVMQEHNRTSYINFVATVEETQINGMQAVKIEPMETDLDSAFRRYIYLFNPEDLVSIIIGTDRQELSMDELEKIAKNLTYEHTQYTMLAYAEGVIPATEKKDVYLSENHFVEGNTLTLKNTCDVEIMDITLVDNISGLDMNNFYSEEEVLADTDATGMLVDERITMDTRKAEFADKKLMLVTMELTNMTSRDLTKWHVNSYIDFRYFEQEGIMKKSVNRVGTYAALGSGEWCYLEGTDYTSNEEDRIHSFMCVDIPEGGSKTITMGIVVFEDELDSLYLGVSPYGFEELKEGQIEGRQYVKIANFLD